MYTYCLCANLFSLAVVWWSYMNKISIIRPHPVWGSVPHLKSLKTHYLIIFILSESRTITCPQRHPLVDPASFYVPSRGGDLGEHRAKIPPRPAQTRMHCLAKTEFLIDSDHGKGRRPTELEFARQEIKRVLIFDHGCMLTAVISKEPVIS